MKENKKEINSNNFIQELNMKNKKIENLKKELELIKGVTNVQLLWKNELQKYKYNNILPIMTELTKHTNSFSYNPLFNNYIFVGEESMAIKTLKYTHENKIDFIYAELPSIKNKNFYFEDELYENDYNYFAKWLTFMDYNIRNAFNLLTNDGVIVLNVNENELAYLETLCNSIFGQNNLLYKITRLVKKSKKFSTEFDYFLIYSKNKTTVYDLSTTNLDNYLDKFKTYDMDKEIKNDIYSYKKKPKTFSLLSQFLEPIRKNNPIILDMFSMNGYLAETIVRLNLKDKQERTFILCSNENNYNITKNHIDTIFKNSQINQHVFIYRLEFFKSIENLNLLITEKIKLKSMNESLIEIKENLYQPYLIHEEFTIYEKNDKKESFIFIKVEDFYDIEDIEDLVKYIKETGNFVYIYIQMINLNTLNKKINNKLKKEGINKFKIENLPNNLLKFYK